MKGRLLIGLVLFLALGFILASGAETDKGRPLSEKEMSLTTGKADCKCNDVTPATDCHNDPQDECRKCAYVSGDPGPQCPGSLLGKLWANTDYNRCTFNMGDKVCQDNGTMRCWTTWECEDSGVINDRVCDEYDLCQTPHLSFNCRRCKRKNETQTKRDVTPQTCT